MSRNDSRPSPTLGQLMSSVSGGRKSEPIAAVFSFTPVSVIDTGLGSGLPPIDIKSVQTTTDELDPFPFNSAFQRYALALMEHNPNSPGRTVVYGLPTDRALTVLSDVNDTQTFVQSNPLLKNISVGEDGSNVQPDVSVKDHPLETIPGSFDQADLAKPGITSARSYSRPAHAVGGAVYDMLRSKNMYNPSDSSPYLNYVGEGENAFSKGLWSFQNELGSFNKDAKTVTVLELREAAATILSRAQSISNDQAKTMAANIRGNSANGTQDLVMLIPHATQIGLGKISFDNLRLRIHHSSGLLQSDAQNDLLAVQSFDSTLGVHPDPEGRGDFTHLLPAMSADSFGTMNSPMEQFGGVMPFGMILPVFYFMVAVQLLGFISTPEMNREGVGPDSDANSPWTLGLGQKDAGAYSFFERMMKMYGFDVGGTGDKFFSSMILGLTSFFGVSQLPNPLGALIGGGAAFLNGLESIIYGPGYYLVAIKGCLRDLEQVTEAFSSLVSTPSFFTIISGIFSLIESVLSSYLFRFMAVMVKLGRQVRLAYTSGFRPHGHVASGDKAHVPLAENAYQYRTKSTRVSEDGGGIKQLSPLSLKTYASAFIADPVTVGMKVPLRTDENKDKVFAKNFNSPGRLSAEHVAEIESLIDKDFCPFSIHDVRTNEVIALPAFIETVNEDFAANYTETIGYGRTDPVYTYSNTKRSINLTFHLVAMNKEDHDFMYLVLNKLTAMLYPQRSQGFLRKTKGEATTNDTGNQFFVQPFSQVPVASPIVRIKLGDLLKSNASSTAMRRLFGGVDILGLDSATKASQVSEKAHEAMKKRQESIQNRSNELTKKAEKFANGTFLNEVFLIGDCTIHMQVKGKYYKTTLSEKYRNKMPFKATEMKEFTRAEKTTTTPAEGQPQQTVKQKFYVIEPDIPGVEQDKNSSHTHELYGESAALHAEVAGANNQGSALSAALGATIGTTGETGITFLIACSDQNVKMINSDVGEGKPFSDVQSFMSAEKNPIVHAFKNIGGEGLAGVITQFGLEYDGSTWGIEAGSGLRAPKHIKINLSFSPIHDMPLGVDYQGAIFAPTHPVGPYTKSRYNESFESLYGGVSNITKAGQEMWTKNIKENKYPGATTEQKENYAKQEGSSGLGLPSF